MWVHWVPGQSNQVGRGRVTEAEDMIGLGTDTINRGWGALVTAVVGSRERQRRGLAGNGCVAHEDLPSSL